jgi:hypothetical protein
LATWDDADFEPARAAIIEAMMSSSADSAKAKAALSRDELSQYASLLDNEIVFGYIVNPNQVKGSEAGHESQKNPWNGMFLIYDHTGKEATLARLLLRVRMNEKDPPKISAATIAGISAIRIERKDGATFWADDGKYTLAASEPAVFEKISAWTKHATPEAATLSQTAAYREAGDLLKGGLMEFFFHFPSMIDRNWDTSVMGFRLRPLIQSLKLEAVHSIAGRLALEGARTRFRGAILGHASPGSLFDIWDEGSTSPSSWQFITANTVSYQEWRVNLLGIHALLKRALQSTVGAGQPSPMDFVETEAAARLGMPLPEAIGLFSGEFATLQSSSTLDPAKRVYVVGIRKKAATLKVLRAGLAERVTGQRSESDATFLRISAGGMGKRRNRIYQVLSPGGDSRCHRRFCARRVRARNPGVSYNHAWRKYLGAAGVAKSARAISQDHQRIELLRLSENRLDRCERAVDCGIPQTTDIERNPTRSRARCFCKCPERFGSASVSSSPAYDCQRIVERRAGYAL